jgi:hypothetical protein
MFDITNDSGLFAVRHELEITGRNLAGNTFAKGTARMLPLYEAKMANRFDHRYGGLSETLQYGLLRISV